MKEIVWLGPMGDDPTSKRAEDLRDNIIEKRCEDNGFALIFAQSIEATNWFEELKAKIASVSGVICDISGERPNVYFEFGFAHALKVPTILLCQSGTKVHIDLINIQRHDYEVYGDVIPKLEQWLKSLWDLNGILQIQQVSHQLPHPFKIIEGDGTREYIYSDQPNKRPFVLEDSGEEPLSCDSIAKMNPDTGDLIKKINTIQKDVADRKGRPFFNGVLIGYVNHTPIRDESGNRFGARIKYRQTDYHTFVATHYPLEALEEALVLNLIEPSEAKELDMRIINAKQSPDWPLALALTVTVFVILEYDQGDFIIFQSREHGRNFHARYSLQGTAAGMIHLKRILDQNGPAVLVPQMAFTHELYEEVGLNCDRKDIKILGLIREEVSDEIGFVGYVKIAKENWDKREIEIDNFEKVSLEQVALKSHDLMTFLSERANHGKDLSPLSLGALAMILINKFTTPVMKEIFQTK